MSIRRSQHRGLPRSYLLHLITLFLGLLALMGGAFAGSVNLAWDAVSGAAGYRVHYGTTSATYTANLNTGSKTSATVAGLTDGTRYYFAVTAYAGTVTSGYSNEVTTYPSSGLVAAYGFNETSGLQVLDASGKGNHGTISNAVRTKQAKFGRALSFSGSNSLVTVSDSSSLDLTGGMTLSAWVYPTTSASGRKTVIMKERIGGLAYALGSNSDAGLPDSTLRIGGSDRQLTAGSHLPSNVWTHLAATYNGATQRLYVNGVQVGSRAQTGTLDVSANPLRIGGNTVWANQYFQGLIDEVRVYNCALSQAEIVAVSQQPVVSQPPVVK